MSDSTAELLRQLLPRYFWLRDAEDGGGVLDAVVGRLAAQYDALSLELDTLLDDVFIQTCAPGYVPLIGDLIGVSGLAAETGPGLGDRSWVGRVISFRKRKGLLATSGRAVAAATGWAAYIQEGRSVVGAAESMQHSGYGPRLIDLTSEADVDAVCEPWSASARMASISGRPIMAGEPSGIDPGTLAGYPSPRTVAISIWRLRSYPVTGRTAHPALDAPERLRGRAFRFDPLGRDTRLFAAGIGVDDRLTAPSVAELPLPLTQSRLAAALSTVPAGQSAPVTIAGCGTVTAGDLSGWQPQPSRRPADAVVDPVLGRLLLTGAPRERLSVDYVYGFPGELGGGPYGTPGDYSAVPPGASHYVVNQGGVGSAVSLQSAIERAAGGDATIVIADSATYPGTWELTVAATHELRIASAPEAAPLLDGPVHVHVEEGGRLELSGLSITGPVTVDGAGVLAMQHSAVSPAAQEPSIVVDGGIALSLDFVIAVGGVEAHGDSTVTATSSIIDGSLRAERPLDLQRVTILGEVVAPGLVAADCLFTQPVTAPTGLVKTSYIPAGSASPPPVQCQGAEVGRPQFVSTRWGDPAYCQLDLRGPWAIASGASRGGEMGAYHWLGQTERFARLPIVLHELLPAGVGASVNYLD